MADLSAWVTTYLPFTDAIFAKNRPNEYFDTLKHIKRRIK
jgi:hypothetical protein